MDAWTIAIIVLVIFICAVGAFIFIINSQYKQAIAAHLASQAHIASQAHLASQAQSD